MSRQETDRLGLIQAVVNKRMKQWEAAQQLGLSLRQVKRLVQRYRRHGPAGLISRHRGKPPNNARFAVPAQNPTDAHRPVQHSRQELALILCAQHRRKPSKNLSVQFKNREYQLQGQGRGHRLRGAEITVCEGFDGAVTLLHKGHVMDYRMLAEGASPFPATSAPAASAASATNRGHF